MKAWTLLPGLALVHSYISIILEWCLGAILQWELVKCWHAVRLHTVRKVMQWCAALMPESEWPPAILPLKTWKSSLCSWTLSPVTSLDAPATTQVAAAMEMKHTLANRPACSGALGHVAGRQPRFCNAAREHLCPMGPNRKRTNVETKALRGQEQGCRSVSRKTSNRSSEFTVFLVDNSYHLLFWFFIILSFL